MSGKSVHQKAALLRDSVYAAHDGIITTFAVVAGSLGASLSVNIILILGFANLVADGISMASGNYLGIKSEKQYEKKLSSNYSLSEFEHAAYTFFFFVLAGLIPLIPFLLGLEFSFVFSTFFVATALVVVGVVRSLITDKHWIRGGIEVLIVGGLAATAAYLIGYMIKAYIN